jgi:hypothetical protein
LVAQHHFDTIDTPRTQDATHAYRPHSEIFLLLLERPEVREKSFFLEGIPKARSSVVTKEPRSGVDYQKNACDRMLSKHIATTRSHEEELGS